MQYPSIKTIKIKAPRKLLPGAWDGGAEDAETKAEKAREEAERWRNLAAAMHTFVVDQVLLPPTQ